jgi:Family of unknown function (DUF6011)
MSRYKWVHCPAGCQGHPAPPNTCNPTYYTSRLFDVGINADGTLYNPASYPGDLVRTAVLAADTRRHEHRSRASKKAAETRREARVHITARRIAANQNTGPRHHCYVCGRGLADPQSIARGIGSECWQSVLDAITAITARLPGTSFPHMQES